MKASLIWVSKDKTDGSLLLAGRHGEGGYPIAMLLDFCLNQQQRTWFGQYRELWRKHGPEYTEAPQVSDLTKPQIPDGI